jgi:cell division protein FtsB
MKLLAPGFRVSLVLLSLALVGCGPSQADYDRMKQQVQTVTAERDNLKTQLDQVQAKVASLQQQVTNFEQAAAAKADAADGSKAAGKAAGKKKAKGKPTRRKHR